MIAHKQYGGVVLIVIGALLLGIGDMAGLTSSNLLLLGGLLMVFVGVVLHVRQQKKCEKY
jgi:hypothetical protein